MKINNKSLYIYFLILNGKCFRISNYTIDHIRVDDIHNKEY